MDDNAFEGKVALVTGAGQGIGRVTARAFAQAGAHVVVASRNAGRAEEVHDELDGSGHRWCSVDVSRPEQIEELLRVVADEYGRLDCAFNNAGVTHPAAPLHEQEIDDCDQVLDVNTRGVFVSMKYEIPLMLASGGGVIVNDASALGLVGTGGECIYSASKHAVIGLTKSAALDYARRDIRINAVAPGGVETRQAEETDPGKMAEYREAHPMGRIAEPEDVAAAVLYLSGDGARNITGTVLVTDGGYTAR